MRTWQRTALGIMLALTATAAPLMAGSASAESRAEAPQRDILARINALRAQQGLQPVRPSEQLAQIAGGRSADMVARSYFSHTFPGCDQASSTRWSNSTPPQPCNVLALFDAQHIAYVWAGEILEWNLFLTRVDQPSADQMAVGDFLRSPAHAAIMLDSRFDQAGVGVAFAPDGKMLVTVLFTQSTG